MLKVLRAKVFALVRIQYVYDVPNLLNLFKAHIWSKMEYYSGALLIAGEVKLRKLDKMQRGFLYALGLDDKIAFVDYNFAPPALRRAIGMLGFLHKRILGECHPALEVLLLARGVSAHAFHTKQLESHFDEVCAYRTLYNNSIYMYILIYNRLPQELVDCETVKGFQGKLTQLAKIRAQNDSTSEWRNAFQSCGDVVNFFYG